MTRSKDYIPQPEPPSQSTYRYYCARVMDLCGPKATPLTFEKWSALHSIPAMTDAEVKAADRKEAREYIANVRKRL
jgi:hypothetical protein